MEQKKYLYLKLFGVFIGILGFVLIGVSVGWLVSTGMFLMIFGHNIEKHI